MEYNAGGALTKTHVYTSISSNTKSTTEYGYNKNGQMARTKDPTGTIVRFSRDEFARITYVFVGTDDTGTWADNASTPPSGGNMRKTGQFAYASGTMILTSERAYPDSVGSPSSYREVTHEHDWKRRRSLSYGEGASGVKDFCVSWQYNNLNQVTKEIRHAGWSLVSNVVTPSTNTLERQENYDELGRSWKTVLHHSGFTLDKHDSGGIGSATADDITTYRWFAKDGLPVKEHTLGTAASKMAYDSARRLQTIYRTDGGGDAAAGASGSLADAKTVTGDNVLEQTVLDMTIGGMARTATTYLRDDDATLTGSLSGTPADCRPQYVQTYYDAAGRVTATVDYGCNGSSESSPSYGSSAPSSSDTVHVWSTSYSTTTGAAYRLTSPDGVIAHYEYDDAGRLVTSVDNYTNWDGTLSTIGGGTNNDQDRVTKYEYDASGRITKIIAYQSSSEHQDTEYVYGVTTSSGTGPSQIVSNSLLRAIVYPDSTGSSDRVQLAYNGLGEPIWIMDQRGVVREFAYDSLGRLLSDTATTIPSGVSNGVQRLERSYNLMGWAESLTSRSGTSGTSTVVNQVANSYSGFGLPIKQRQSHSGETASTSLASSRTYADGDDSVRMASLIYPSSASVSYTYDSGIDATTSRLSSMSVSGVTIAQYDYLGLSTPVIVDYPQSDLNLDYTRGADSGSDRYKSLDRFGRVTLLHWVHTPGSATGDAAKIAYTYDRLSNRLSHDEQTTFPTAAGVVKRDELYTYDGLHRLIENQRGILSTGGGGALQITTGDREQTQQWTLDMLGNWDRFKYDGNGDEDFADAADLDDDRAHAAPSGAGGSANEISGWDPYPADSSNSALQPDYDAAGNLADDKYQYKYTYDAWNRLTKVETTGGSPAIVGAYTYDAIGRRVKRVVGLDTIHEYYTPGWQRIEVRPNTSETTTGGSVFVYGARYVDDILMRQRDANGDGTAEERRYYVTDANFNVILLTKSDGSGVERVFYNAYGEPECYPFGDADGDYDVDAADATEATKIKNGQSPYNLFADIDIDGDVDQTDLNAGTNYAGYVGGAGTLTASSGSATNGNESGFAGYLWNDERAQWHVRYRDYSPLLGRWLQRDPVGYVDGMSLYTYTADAPTSRIDPLGLWCRDGNILRKQPGDDRSTLPPELAPYVDHTLTSQDLWELVETMNDIVREHNGMLAVASAMNRIGMQLQAFSERDPGWVEMYGGGQDSSFEAGAIALEAGAALADVGEEFARTGGTVAQLLRAGAAQLDLLGGALDLASLGINLGNLTNNLRDENWVGAVASAGDVALDSAGLGLSALALKELYAGRDIMSVSKYWATRTLGAAEAASVTGTLATIAFAINTGANVADDWADRDSARAAAESYFAMADGAMRRRGRGNQNASTAMSVLDAIAKVPPCEQMCGGGTFQGVY